MRKPGFRAFPQEALDEAAAALTTCPMCNDPLNNDEVANWDTRVVRARSCTGHGYFFIKWSPVKKLISVEWIFDRCLPDL